MALCLDMIISRKEQGKGHADADAGAGADADAGAGAGAGAGADGDLELVADKDILKKAFVGRFAIASTMMLLPYFASWYW